MYGDKDTLFSARQATYTFQGFSVVGALTSFYFVRIVGRKKLFLAGFFLNTILLFGASSCVHFELFGLATILMFFFAMN